MRQRNQPGQPKGLHSKAISNQLYCQRSATAGSTRSARQAGIAADASVTNTVNPVAAAYTSGSAGDRKSTRLNSSH